MAAMHVKGCQLLLNPEEEAEEAAADMEEWNSNLHS